MTFYEWMDFNPWFAIGTLSIICFTVVIAPAISIEQWMAGKAEIEKHKGAKQNE